MRRSWIRPERRRLLETVRALSAMRRARHGVLPEDAGVWWQQITDLAAEHGIDLPAFEHWHNAGKPEQWELPL